MIIFLNGSINAGKSTVARILAKELPNSALVEIDALREMISWMPIDQAVPINLENAVSVIRNFTALRSRPKSRKYLQIAEQESWRKAKKRELSTTTILGFMSRFLER